jgi:hypothetical protein
MDKENDLDLIIDYINGELSAEQKIVFEQRLVQEMDLAESLKIQKEIHQAFLRMQIREQVKSIHEDAKILDQAEQNKAIGFSKNLEAKPSFINSENKNEAQVKGNILLKIAAVFFPIIFIVGLWAWFNHKTKSTKPISSYVAPIENDSTNTPPTDKLNNEKNNLNQNNTEASILKRIDIVQLNPDVSFGFGPKKEVSKNIFIKRIINSSNGINSMYRLNADTLFLFLNTNSQSEEFLFEIQHDEESQSTLENGFYLMFDNIFFKLNNDNKLNKLILLENKYQVNEFNKLIKRK